MTKMTVLRSTLIPISLLLMVMSGCRFGETVEERFLRDAKKAESLNAQEQVTFLENYALETTNKNVKLSAIKRVVDLLYRESQYHKVRKYLLYVLQNSPTQQGKLEAQQQLADNSFFHLNKYKEAIYYYSKLVEQGYQSLSNRLMIAKSYFQTDDLLQANIEADSLLKEKLKPNFRFELLLMKANIAFSGESFRSSSKLFQSVIKEFPDLSKKNFVLLNLAMSLEEEGLVDQAVGALQELKSFYHTPSFIESKIQHLFQKREHMPGARRNAR